MSEWEGDPDKPCENCGEPWYVHRPQAGLYVGTYEAICPKDHKVDPAAAAAYEAAGRLYG